MEQHLLFIIICILWIIGSLIFFNRNKSKTLIKENNQAPERLPAAETLTKKSQVDLKVAILMDKDKPEPHIIADFIVKYSDLLNGTYLINEADKKTEVKAKQPEQVSTEVINMDSESRAELEDIEFSIDNIPPPDKSFLSESSEASEQSRIEISQINTGILE